MIEERSSNLQGVGHAHAVDFGQNVSRKICLGVQKEHFAERIRGGPFFEIASQAVVRRSLHCSPGHKVRSKERRLAYTDWEKRHFVQITVTSVKRKIE